VTERRPPTLPPRRGRLAGRKPRNLYTLLSSAQRYGLDP
jgi:hypothetical protein